jgi:uncharacterized protein YndB with AHSA1/START domain
VWRALTDRASLERWLAPPPGVEMREAEPGRVLELDWRPAGEEPSHVRVEVRAEGGGTVLVLEHRQIAAVLGMRYLSRWTARLARLDEVVA